MAKQFRWRNAPPGNERAAIEAHIRSSPISPRVREIEVRHDGWCASLTGVRPCNCSPDVVDITPRSN